MQNRLSYESNKKDIGTITEVLIEGNSKKSDQDWMGRNSQYKVVVFPKAGHNLKPGDYAMVKVHDCTQGTLLGTII
jgi:tRNA-2-methylthio-N6-dimethylallyladenosine synthase